MGTLPTFVLHNSPIKFVGRCMIKKRHIFEECFKNVLATSYNNLYTN